MNRSLYDPAYEHDACGVGLVADLNGNKTHQLVSDGLTMLENLKHRGAEGADAKTGDGAGIMVQIPHEFILLQGIPVPERSRYGTGLVFLPKDAQAGQACLDVLRTETQREGLVLSNVREVPVNSDILGETARACEPHIVQVFITGADSAPEGLETRLYRIRKHVEQQVSDKDFYIVSLSSRVLVYKGMLTSTQLKEYYPDLSSPFFTSGLALVHSRFSTNTFPAWSLAQPFRMMAHNGEINTIRGNRGWMEARESVLSSPALGDVRDIHPIVQPGMSDSASFDNVMEFFYHSGMALPHVMSMMIPESFNEKNPIGNDLKAFYEYHSILMEPWDGPAAILFSDGRYAGGMLDRNGLRPSRYLITDKGLLAIASEAGCLPVGAGSVIEKGSLQPGKILMVDTQTGRIYRNDEIKQGLADAQDYRGWLSSGRIELSKLHSGRKTEAAVPEFEKRLRAFDYTREDVERIIIPMCSTASEPVSSMGNDTQLAALSERPQLLFNYFRQQFAQVTNPPIDPIREDLVMSLTEYIGAVGMNILTPDASHCKMVRLPQPVLTNDELDILCHIRYKGFNTEVLPILFEKSKGEVGLKEALDGLCREAEASVDRGINYIILSDRGMDETHAAIPSLLAVSAIHHYLVRVQKRVQTALIVESGEIRETMHSALLLGYGASAVNPYMAFAIIDDLVKKGEVQLDFETARNNYIRAVDKGLKKILSKMGISTIRSYRGAKIFESIGLGADLLATYFGTPSSTVGGIGLSRIALDAARLHTQGFEAEVSDILPHVGQYSFRKDGILHSWTPEAIAALQQSTHSGDYRRFKEFTSLVDSHPDPMFLRDFFTFKENPIPIEEVEPVEEIVKRFVGAAMSFGAISQGAHEAIAEALNRLGSRSNTGEGGEDRERFHGERDGVSLNSGIKQVASGRFGVTAEYLVNAREIQIKIAQGAKPGEGGQLPGYKVDSIIARTRHSIPGISLISPPPHHDIYSIEDLAQLIFDLRNVNPQARISVKLVAESGVGTVAAGVAKAKADLIVISGAEGGTGASPMSSIRYAGLPPEIGLSEAQQTLVRNGLRAQVTLQTDGQIKTGRDVVAMALLGADEFGFGTAQLIVLGCVLMRKCHTNTCPMGIATRNPELLKRYRGSSEALVNYYRFLAEEVREYLARMGFRKFEDIVGRTDLITVAKAPAGSKAASLDFRRLLAREGDGPFHADPEFSNRLADVLDNHIISAAKPSLDEGRTVSLHYGIANTDRAVGAMLSGRIAARYGETGLPDDTVQVTFHGSAGQSFGAFLMKGVSFRLEGEANDYLGKGLSGGRIIVRPDPDAHFDAAENTIAGNTLLYGATSGSLFMAGRAGERFAVRNSGATAVVEGVGDHCCEYMTGGRVVVLGPTGRNFAAGMSGGLAYVWDPGHNFDYYCNMEMIELGLIEEKARMEELRALIAEHRRLTGSALAGRMLEHWRDYVEDFIQVTPIEYKRVLHEQEIRKLNEKIDNVQRDY